MVLGNAFDTPGITVDTHVGRLSRRWGWTREEDPVKAEMDLAKILPQPLVHEAWLRVSKNEEQQWESQRHFYNTAKYQAMRRILIDRARARQRQKRWGGSERVELEDSQIIAPAPEDELLAVNNTALTKLSQSDPGVAEIVHLRFFAGLKWSEISAITGITERRLRVQWDYAKPGFAPQCVRIPDLQAPRGKNFDECRRFQRELTQ